MACSSRLSRSATCSRAACINHAGLDLAALLDVVRRTGKLDDYVRNNPAARCVAAGTACARSARATPTPWSRSVGPTCRPASRPSDHVKAAFESGKHAVLTNKGPVALAYRELAELARRTSVQFRFEGTVMSGTPTIRLARTALAGCEILEIKGILNGTTNYILTQMEAGQSYADALAEAQRLGYAEADPTADVEGWDAAGKTVILANVLLGGDLRVADVDRTGISGLTLADVEAAKAAGERWKLIARVWQEDGATKASVQPTRLPLSHPLAGVSGAVNACTYHHRPPRRRHPRRPRRRTDGDGVCGVGRFAGYCCALVMFNP